MLDQRARLLRASLAFALVPPTDARTAALLARLPRRSAMQVGCRLMNERVIEMGGMAVSDLLDEGAWTLAQNLRVRYDADRLGQELRALLIAYRSHRLRTIRGSSETSVDGVATLRSLLKTAPGEALCDACLAFACAVSLTDMRAFTDTLLRTEPEFKRASSCASCRRTVPSIVYK